MGTTHISIPKSHWWFKPRLKHVNHPFAPPLLEGPTYFRRFEPVAVSSPKEPSASWLPTDPLASILDAQRWEKGSTEQRAAMIHGYLGGYFFGRCGL